jgi:diketogulonate reductase-like aldo/keto reductase
MKAVKLNTGATMPAIGFGTWKIFPNGHAKKATLEALSAGYRHIDTARIYGNEKGVGQAVRESGIAREELFITTKLWNGDQGYDKALKAFDKSLGRLGMDYVDLYLMHWPVPDKRQESWRAMEEMYKSGRARAIGVSNFLVRHLEELAAASNTVPAVNQVEFHPFLYEDLISLLDYCKQKGIVFEAYSPLAHGKVTDVTVLPAIAKKHGKSTAQIILRWCLQHGTVPLPKSTNPEHIKQNLEVFDFELTPAEMEQINDLSSGTRTAWNPENMP